MESLSTQPMPLEMVQEVEAELDINDSQINDLVDTPPSPKKKKVKHAKKVVSQEPPSQNQKPNKWMSYLKFSQSDFTNALALLVLFLVLMNNQVTGFLGGYLIIH